MTKYQGTKQGQARQTNNSQVLVGEQYRLIKLTILSTTRSFSAITDLIENVSVTKLRMSWWILFLRLDLTWVPIAFRAAFSVTLPVVVLKMSSRITVRSTM